LLGARQGAQHGAQSRGNREELARINDVAWLAARFEEYYANVLKDTILAPIGTEGPVRPSMAR
jgi:hypothetical protein